MKTYLVFTILDQINDYNYPHTKCTKGICSWASQMKDECDKILVEMMPMCQYISLDMK